MSKKKKAKVNEYLCLSKKLPPVIDWESARDSVAAYPGNMPDREGIVALSTMLVPMEGTDTSDLVKSMLAASTTRYWGSDGADLSVSFLDSPPRALIDKILSHSNIWGDFGNVRFRWSQSGGQIRIARNERAYYSYMGRDILRVPANQHTMMLGGFTMNTPDSEFMRVPPHEFGHSLGFIHEHVRKSIVERLDVNKTLALFRKEQGWDDATIWSNVLTSPDESTLTATPVSDETSIMCYMLPASITKNGKPIPGGATLSAADKEFVAKIYPKSVITPDVLEINIPRAGAWVFKG